MLPINLDGKIREQVEIENKVRTDYAKKWGPIENMQSYESYDPNKYNLKLNKFSTDPKYENSGESYFVSKEMFENLLEKCRCGRKKTGGHLLKCLQSVKFEHEDDKSGLDPPLPKTSSAIIGWPNMKYSQWDRMTRVKTVNENIVGHGVMDHPYSNIYIG